MCITLEPLISLTVSYTSGANMTCYIGALLEKSLLLSFCWGLSLGADGKCNLFSEINYVLLFHSKIRGCIIFFEKFTRTCTHTYTHTHVHTHTRTHTHTHTHTHAHTHTHTHIHTHKLPNSRDRALIYFAYTHRHRQRDRDTHRPR